MESYGIDIVPYSINQPLKLGWIQMQMGEVYTMVQHAGRTECYTMV